jgi:hypothetical protein
MHGLEGAEHSFRVPRSPVYRGAAPPHPALALEGEPDGRWTPWDGGDLDGKNPGSR